MTETKRSSRRVLYVIASLRGGAAEHVLYLMDYFGRQGNTLLLVAPDDCEASADKVERLGVRWIKAPLDRRWSFSGLNLISGILETESIDLLHTHGLRGGLYGRRALARARKAGCRAKSLYTVHGFHPAYYRTALARGLACALERRLFLRTTDHVIFVSEADRAAFFECLKLDREELATHSTLVPNGIHLSGGDNPPSRKEARGALGIAPDAFAVGTLSRLNRQKAVHRLIEVAALLKDDIPRLQVLIAGDGPLQARLERLARRRGVASQVRFLGYYAQAPALYRALDCFVLCSLWEGLPLVLLEAAAAGLPQVATSVAGTTEVLEHERTGLLAAGESVQDLAGQIRRVYSEPALAQNIAREAQTTIPEKFSLEKMLEKTARVYETVSKV